MERVPMRDYGAERRANAGIINNAVAKTAAFTIPEGGSASGTLYTNRGASGSVTFTLPTAPRVGERYEFAKVVAAQDLVIAAAGGKAMLGLTSVTGTITNSTSEHGWIELEYDGTAWIVKGRTGTWVLA